MSMIQSEKLSNKVLAVFLAVKMLTLLSCSAGVKDRSVTSLNGNLSTSAIDAAADEEIQNELNLLDIDQHYQSAKNLFSALEFSKPDHFLVVKCGNSTLQTTINRYHSYAKILYQAAGQDHVAEVLDNVLERMQNDLRKDPSAERLKILLRAIDKIEDLKSKIIEKSQKCATAKIIQSEESEEAPVEDAERSE